MTTQLITKLGLAAGLLTLGCLGKASAAGSCAGGRFLVHGDALIAGTTAPAPDAVVLAGSFVSVASGCKPVGAKVKATRRGTVVRARFAECHEAGRRVVLKAVIDRTCRSMTGTLTAKRPKVSRRFVAALSTCGDGVFDPDAGEQCDDGNAVGGDGCETDCSRSARPATTSTTAPATTTTTTTLAVDPNLPPDDFTPPDFPPDDSGPADSPPDDFTPPDLPF